MLKCALALGVSAQVILVLVAYVPERTRPLTSALYVWAFLVLYAAISVGLVYLQGVVHAAINDAAAQSAQSKGNARLQRGLRVASLKLRLFSWVVKALALSFVVGALIISMSAQLRQFNGFVLITGSVFINITTGIASLVRQREKGVKPLNAVPSKKSVGSSALRSSAIEQSGR